MSLNAKEKHVITSMISDMRHNAKQTQDLIVGKGGLTIEALIQRVNMQARELEQLVNGTYFTRYDD